MDDQGCLDMRWDGLGLFAGTVVPITNGIIIPMANGIIPLANSQNLDVKPRPKVSFSRALIRWAIQCPNFLRTSFRTMFGTKLEN